MSLRQIFKDRGYVYVTLTDLKMFCFDVQQVLLIAINNACAWIYIIKAAFMQNVLSKMIKPSNAIDKNRLVQ